MTKRTNTRIVVPLVVVIAIAAVIIVVLLTRSSPSPSPSANDARSVSGATSVERRDLVETDTESGTLSYSGSQTVYDRLGGTITWLPQIGQLIQPGQPLYKVDNEPVLLMQGTTPAYRELDSSDAAGPDILELNADLVRLNYNPDGIVVDDVWQPATTDAIDQLQYDWGETETGTLTLGQVVFLPGAQLVASVSATVGATGPGGGGASADTGLDAAGPHAEFVDVLSTTTSTTSTTTTPATTATTTPTTTTPTTTTPTTTTSSYTIPTTSTSTHATTTPTTTPSSRTKSPTRSKSSTPGGSKGVSTAEQIAALIALLKSETAQLEHEHSSTPSSTTPSGTTTPSARTPSAKTPSTRTPSTTTTPSKASSTGPSKGSNSSNSSNSSTSSNNSASSNAGGSASAIMQTTSDRLVVTVDLPASSQSEAKAGEHVTVEMPAGNTVDGRITAVSSVATTSSSSGAGSGNGGGSGSATVPVTIALSKRVRGTGLDQAAVSVNFVEARARNVLSVPVTALLATSGGNFAVQEAAAPHTLIPVQTGLFAAGYVQISGSGIYSGLQVTDSQG